MKPLRFVLISFLIVLSSFTTTLSKGKMQYYSCTVYVYKPSGSPAPYVKVTGYYTTSVWSSGTQRVETDSEGKAILTWSSDRPLKLISVWDGQFNYQYHGEFRNGKSYTLTLDKSHIH